MAYDEYLAERVERILRGKNIPFIQKKMMGGLCFMVDDKMCVGVVKNSLMARIAPEKYEDALLEVGAQPMNFTGRPMKGFVFVEPQGTDFDRDLEKWIQLCLDFNPRAKSSKR